jgi:exodeoxyribonuclease-3
MKKIATFNANSIRARLPIVLEWMKEHEPDILCIQETKVQDVDFPVLDFVEAGYNVVFKGQKSYNGVAVISKDKPDKVMTGLDKSKDADEPRIIYTRFGSLHVINTYVPQGREIDHEMYQYKLMWFKRLRKYFEDNFTTRMKVIWVGDINVAPDPMDIHNSEKQTNHVCYHIDARNAFANVLDWGFVDVFRKHHPEPGQYSFFDYRTINVVERNMGWRIDHIQTTPCLARKSIDSYIDIEPRKKEKPSDHTFVVAEFDI